MKPITPARTLVDQTYDILLDAICNGELAPGDRLNQDEIAARLNVSRQPVNSAISILKANRFATDNGRRGVLVAEINPDMFRSIFEFRQLVEPFAVRLADQRMDADAPARMQAILSRGRRSVRDGQVKQQIQADVDFHSAIYEWSRNEVIQMSMQLNWPHIRRSMVAVLRDDEASMRVWDEHEAIAGALLGGRTAEAEDLMRRHIVDAYAALVPILGVGSAPMGSSAKGPREPKSRERH